MSREDVVEEVKKKLKEVEENSKLRLLDGYYKVNDNFIQTWKVEGTSLEMKDPYDSFDFGKASIEYGDFGNKKAFL